MESTFEKTCGRRVLKDAFYSRKHCRQKIESGAYVHLDETILGKMASILLSEAHLIEQQANKVGVHSDMQI
jgi:hypothetical protein